MDDITILRQRLAEISDLSRAAGVLGWDQRVSMPPLGTESRAESLATLGRIIHDRFTDPEIGRLLERLAPLEESLPYDSDDASLIRVTRRDYDKACRVPTELRVEMTRAAASGHHAWVEARRNDDFASFLPYLRANVELKRRYIECFEPADLPYTALLDDYEPGMTTTEVREVFATLRPALTELVRTAPQVDASFLHGSFDPEAQRRFAERVVGTLGFVGRRLAARPDGAPVLHVVLEPRRSADDPLPPGRPRVGLVDAARGGPRPLRPRHRRLADADAARRRAVARDQRVAEPHLGEPRRPQQAVLDALVRTIAGGVPRALGAVDFDDFVRAINRAEPGLIRVDADETTYSLHIILRFELEQELIAGTVELEDLPEIWNARMKEFLGIDVPSNADGVLQDVHWSGGGIGYFPTYALGNVISLQIWAKVREALPDLDDQMAAGDLMELSNWLRDNLYALGPEADAEGDARPADRVGRDRPGAVPRLPGRQDGRRWRPPSRRAGSASTSGSRSAASSPGSSATCRCCSSSVPRSRP